MTWHSVEGNCYQCYAEVWLHSNNKMPHLINVKYFHTAFIYMHFADAFIQSRNIKIFFKAMLPSLPWCLSDLIHTYWRQKSFFFYLFTWSGKLISIGSPQFSGQEGGHFYWGCFLFLTGVLYVWVYLYMRVSIGGLPLCVDTHHSPCHRLKQNMEEILIKALSEPGGLAEVKACVFVCVCVCTGGQRYCKLENVSHALWWSIKTNPASDFLL